MDNEIKDMFELVLKKLDGVDTRLDIIDKKVDNLDKKVDSLDVRVSKLETRMDSMETRMSGMETRMDGMEARQSEMYVLLTSIEENIKVTRAEQEKMSFSIADIQGKVTKLANEVDDHDRFIKQIKAIK